MKVLAVLSLLLVGSLCISLNQQVMGDLFTQWKLTHNKAYTGGHEEQLRFNIFTQNYLSILKINSEQSDVILGLNQFADLTSEEFKMMYTGFNKRQRTHGDATELNLRDLPAKVDWRSKGAVSGVKNQGSCGSCWAFSAIGALEGLYFIDHADLKLFSEQNIVDCTQAQSEGCNGGWMTDAFDYVAANGVNLGSDYPYTARTGKCNNIPSKAVKINTAYANVTIQSTVAMKTALVLGPVSVAIEADQLVFQFYKAGVITKIMGCGDDLDHGVLAVGYDTFSGIEAFIVKNSWGSTWGNSGYVLIGTDETANKGNGVCGILADAAYPTSH